MKFKFLFITFNIVLITTFLFIFFIPLAILGTNFTKNFWNSNWILFLIFLFFIVLINTLFIKNRRLLLLLEAEDWPALTMFLEHKIYVKKHISKRSVKMLCDSYMVLSDFAGVQRLSVFVSKEKPSVFIKCLLSFSAVLVVQKKPSEAAMLIESYADAKSVQKSQWIQWYYAFAVYATHDYEKAQKLFCGVLQNTSNTIIAALCVFLLEDRISLHTADSYAAITSTVTNRKTEIITKFSLPAFEKAIECEKTDLPIVVLSSLLDDTKKYFYEKK